MERVFRSSRESCPPTLFFSVFSVLCFNHLLDILAFIQQKHLSTYLKLSPASIKEHQKAIEQWSSLWDTVQALVVN